MPPNQCRMCALRKEDIIALQCITTKATNTNNVVIFAYGVLSHGFLGQGCTVRRQNHIHTKGIGIIIHPRCMSSA